LFPKYSCCNFYVVKNPCYRLHLIYCVAILVGKTNIFNWTIKYQKYVEGNNYGATR